MKTIFAILAALIVNTITVTAVPVGQTSEWGIVVTPCAWCGRTNDIQVHHIIPQAECKRIGRLDLIRSHSNMVCLCRTDGKGCHFYIGHHAKSWDYVFTNIIQILKLSPPVPP